MCDVPSKVMANSSVAYCIGRLSVLTVVGLPSFSPNELMADMQREEIHLCQEQNRR